MKNQIKSVLRNKSNIIYIFTFVILFAILNVALTIRPLVDQYFDNIVEEYSNTLQTQLNKISSYENIKIDELAKTIQISKELTDEQKTEIENIKHVERLEIQKIDLEGEEVHIQYLYLDDWKNFEYVNNRLDALGISGSPAVLDEQILESYSTIRNIANTIQYLLIIVSLLVIIVCCRNIVKNEQKNIKLLQIFGYKKSKIKQILFVEQITMLIIGLIFGIVLYELLYFLLVHEMLNISVENNAVMMVAINAIIILLPAFLSIHIKTLKS